jgi:thiol-disulfide isomerase/thioredoxin
MVSTMKLSFSLAAGILFASFITHAALPSAEEVLAGAKTRAVAENKVIFVHFGASWCGWCKRLDAFLERDDIKPVFEKYFIPVKLVVSENEKNKALENAGGDAVERRLGGPAGLPFSAFLDSKGDLIINSKKPDGANGQNIGYPFEPDEVDFFVAMMKKASPKMPEADLKTIETVLRNQKK